MNPSPDDTDTTRPGPARILTPAAQRALAEAALRRKAQAPQDARNAPQELGGREGPEPIRFGDWENKGIATDF